MAVRISISSVRASHYVERWLRACSFVAGLASSRTLSIRRAVKLIGALAVQEDLTTPGKASAVVLG